MARTQKVFNQGRSYSHQDANQGDWANGEMITMTQTASLSVKEDQDAADPPLRTLNVFYQGTNVVMLKETYQKFKKNILPKIKKKEPTFKSQ